MPTSVPVERYLGAYGLCTAGAASILLVRVSDGSESGRWTLPGGGVEPLVHPDTTVAREFAEETGITTASIGPVLGIYSHVRPADQSASDVPSITSRSSTASRSPWLLTSTGA